MYLKLKIVFLSVFRIHVTFFNSISYKMIYYFNKKYNKSCQLLKEMFNDIHVVDHIETI